MIQKIPVDLRRRRPKRRAKIAVGWPGLNRARKKITPESAFWWRSRRGRREKIQKPRNELALFVDNIYESVVYHGRMYQTRPELSENSGKIIFCQNDRR
jgi:hypothetical protein